MLGNADTDQSRKTNLCYTPAEDYCNSPIRPPDGRNNFAPLTR